MATTKRESHAPADSGIGNGTKRHHYKLWVLAAIILVALWSMFTGSVTLKWSAISNNDDFDSMILEYLDVLEVEEREKVVRHMWDVYAHSNTVGLPKFWSEAFQAAFEVLVSDVPDVQDAAVSEIAKMSLRSLPLLQSHSTIMGSRKIKQAESSKDSAVGSNH